MKPIRKWLVLRWRLWGVTDPAIRKHIKRSVGGQFKTYKGRNARVSAS